jgi:hypothetical protein
MENNFTGLEDTLYFKGGKRVLKQLENILENKYELSNVVVTLCEIFLYLTDKKEMKWFSEEPSYMNIKLFGDMPLDRLVTNFRRFRGACWSTDYVKDLNLYQYSENHSHPH